jgi:peptidoglycan/LPS O-acetylase OafA/YrhL|tara:strand:+ start:3261 stop:4310 length:1050 start_codon:yes stop_codon:yes gene_type:complete
MKKFSYIELLRFFTALSVLTSHYLHFFYPWSSYTDIDVLDRSILPFFWILEIIYEHGRYGVQMFWAISGFVFAFVYLEQKNKVSSKEFLVNRFARLYPLHFLTLIFVTALQVLSFKINGKYQIYFVNDFYHFFINLFYVNGWPGLAKESSFNAPTWSVSIELLIYFLFFISIIYINKFKIKLIILIYILLLLIDKNFISTNFYKQALFDCARLFYSGILVYYLYLKFNNKKYLIIFSLIMILISLIGSFKIFILFPSIILLFATFGTIKSYNIKYLFQFSGDLTYAIYLLHIPIQILIILIFGYLNISSKIFLSGYTFLSFIVLMIFLASICFHLFEKPLNKKIRKYFS